ncbi:hypothetical protein Tco_0597563 [Tanacetum coccineum]
MENVPPAVDEVASMMNVKIHQEESSTQAPSLFTVPKTAIPETATAHTTTYRYLDYATQQNSGSLPLRKFEERKSSRREEVIHRCCQEISKDIIKDEVKSLLPQILPKEVSNFATPVIQSTITESLENVVLAKSSSQPQSTYEAAASLRTRQDGKAYSLKRSHEDKDKDEDPLVGPNQGLKKKNFSQTGLRHPLQGLKL